VLDHGVYVNLNQSVYFDSSISSCIPRYILIFLARWMVTGKRSGSVFGNKFGLKTVLASCELGPPGAHR
jgi:hypothetical protein